MRRIAVSAGVVLVALVGPPVALGQTLTDPADDNCRDYTSPPGNFCGPDITEAVFSLPGDGFLHVDVTYDDIPTNMIGGNPIPEQEEHIELGIYPNTAAAPDFNVLAYRFVRVGSTWKLQQKTTGGLVPVADGSALTDPSELGIDLRVPVGPLGDPADYYFALNSGNIGEVIPEHPELAPNTGLFALEGPAVSAVDDEILTGFDVGWRTNVLSNDTVAAGSVPLVASFTQPAGGSVVCSVAGLCTFEPSSGFSGGTSFNYTLSDGQGGTDTATVNVGTEAFLAGERKRKSKAFKSPKAARRAIRKDCSRPGTECGGVPNVPPADGSAAQKTSLKTANLRWGYREWCSWKDTGDGFGSWNVNIKAYESSADTGVDKFKLQWRDQAIGLAGRWATSAQWKSESSVIKNANQTVNWFGFYRQPTPGPERHWSLTSTNYHYRVQVRAEFINVRKGIPDENYSAGWFTVCEGQPQSPY